MPLEGLKRAFLGVFFCGSILAKGYDMKNKALNAKIRALLLKKYGHRYKRHWATKTGCFYCGDDWSQLDHVPPISWCDAKNIAWFKERKIGFYLVQACGDCNRLLHNRPLFRLEERSRFIREKLENKVENAAHWTKEEINEMGEFFKKSLLAYQQGQKILLNRLRHAQNLQFRPEDFPLE